LPRRVLTLVAERPVTVSDFALRLDRLGPFEPRPALAVAVSGGADSLALCLLSARWAARRGGTAVGLVVDHGLRPEARAEARQVTRWLAARGVACRVLRWRGPKPATGLAAAAREARYGLLAAWCRRHSRLHLLLAHHCEDQAETLLFRLGRGSGLDGLAAMAAIAERDGVRLLRPLLDLPKARLVATLQAAGQPWVEDPSNRDERYARVRLRALAPALADEGVTPAAVAETAARLGVARAGLEAAVAGLLASSAELDAAGYVRLDAMLLARAPDDIARRALGGVLACVGGAPHPPRRIALERLLARLRTGPWRGARTLGGCQLGFDDDGLRVCRELRAAGERFTLAPGGAALWDGRFAVRLDRSGSALSRRRAAALEVRALGAAGWRALRGTEAEAAGRALPNAARLALPALWDLEGVCSVPHLNFWRPGRPAVPAVALDAVFRPRRPLCPLPFAVAPAG
jgi:tRNA(Ile)-lysidine synthase